MTLLTKNALKSLVSESKTEETFSALKTYPKKLDLPAIEKELILQSAKWAEYELDKMRGSVSYENLSQRLVQIQSSLLDIIEKLPDEITVQAALHQVKPKEFNPSQLGIPEDKFKNQVFILMIITKVIVFGWIYFHYQTGGFIIGEAQATAAILLPVFAAYFSAMMDEKIRNRYVSDKLVIKKERYIRNSLRYITYALFPLYTYFLIVIIGWKAQGLLAVKPEESLEQMNSLLALVETGLGVYIGQVVFALFKKET